MMHANKMILVPHDIHGRDDISNKIMSNLDKEMHKILNDKTLPVDTKIIYYNQILHRHRKAKEEQERPYKLEIQEPEISSIIDESIVVNEKQSEEETVPNPLKEIIRAVPSKNRNNAKLLFDYVKRNPHMKWTDKGELVIEGNKIVGSNIVDLICDFSRESKIRHPAIGSEFFVKSLVQENIPRESIVNKKRFELLDSQPVVASPKNMIAPLSGNSVSGTPFRQNVWKKLGF